MLWVYDSGALYYIYFLYLTGNIIESDRISKACFKN